MKRTLVRIGLFGAVLLTIALLVLLINQTAQLFQLASAVHPLLGQVVLWALIAVYVVCLVAPVYLFVRLPEPLVPPDAEASPDFEKHKAALKRRLGTNPLLKDTPVRTDDEMQNALGILDAKADEAMKAAAGRVFIATAISQNGALDSILVLGAQTRLIWRIARIYYQRPTLRDAVYLYANVVSTAFLAGELNDADVAERIQPILGATLGSAVGAIPGFQTASSLFINSVFSGSANAFLTLRVGIITRGYCRALVRPTKGALRRSAIVGATAMLSAVVASGVATVSRAITHASGKTLTKAAKKVGGSVKDTGEWALSVGASAAARAKDVGSLFADRLTDTEGRVRNIGSSAADKSARDVSSGENG